MSSLAPSVCRRIRHEGALLGSPREDGRKRHRRDLQALLDASRTYHLLDRLLQLAKCVGEAYWIRHTHSPFGLALTSGTTGSLEVYSTCVSWEFIGDSSPAATVEGARRSLCIPLHSESKFTAAGFVLRPVKRRQSPCKRAQKD